MSPVEKTKYFLQKHGAFTHYQNTFTEFCNSNLRYQRPRNPSIHTFRLNLIGGKDQSSALAYIHSEFIRDEKTHQDVRLIELADQVGERTPVGEQPDTDSQRRSSGDLQDTNLM